MKSNFKCIADGMEYGRWCWQAIISFLLSLLAPVLFSLPYLPIRWDCNLFTFFLILIFILIPVCVLTALIMGIIGSRKTGQESLRGRTLGIIGTILSTLCFFYWMLMIYVLLITGSYWGQGY